MGGTSLVVQWLRLCTSTAGGMGLIPGRGTKIPHATHGQKKKKKNRFFFCLKEYYKYLHVIKFEILDLPS